MVQNAYGEDEGACVIANGSSLKVKIFDERVVSVTTVTLVEGD